MLPLREARRRWAELLRRIYEVGPLACPACGGAMRILAFITEGAVIDRILAHLRRARDTRPGHPTSAVATPTTVRDTAEPRQAARLQRSSLRPYGDSISYP